MFFDDDADELFKSKPIFFLDTNLNNPVLLTEIESTRQLIELTIDCQEDDTFARLKFRERTEVSKFRHLCKSSNIRLTHLSKSRSLDPSEYPELETGFRVNSGVNDKLYDKAHDMIKEVEEALCIGLEKRGLPSAEILGTSLLLNHPSITSYRNAYAEFCDLFGRAESIIKDSEFSWVSGRVGSVNIYIHSKYGLIGHNGQVYYSSLNQILMLKDKIATRYMLLEHALPLGYDEKLMDHLLNLFKWQDETLSLYGNEAYTLLKAVEPMFKTRLSHIVNNIFGSETAYTRMIVKIKEKEQKLSPLYHRLTTSVESLCDLVESVVEIPHLVELFGCMKSCGHPLIDTRLGGLSASEEARSDDTTKLNDAYRLRNTFCHIVLVSYIKQHGIWPKLIHLDPNTKLSMLNDRQERYLTYSSYDLEDWNLVHWQQILDFDYFPNYLELMDDKAISLYKSEKHCTWDKTKQPTSHRRLLLELLNRRSFDIKGIVDRVSRRDIPEDWFIVSLYPKEREFKLEPRMFSMLVIEMRCFFACIEANLADKLFRYLPQQTMTKSKTQNQERFLSFTDPARDKHLLTLFIEIDLTRWNLRWREMVIHLLGHDLNCMFGVKGTFTVTHWFFNLCQIVVRVQGLRPDGIELANPPITDLAWTGHKGGFEGLNQKLWTAATYAMMEVGLVPLMLNNVISSYELIGQGDNQVVRLSIPDTGEDPCISIPRVRDQVNAALEDSCRRVNQIVKPDENIESTSVLTYSKDVFVNGVEYPTSLKKHSRLFPVTSLDFPSVTSNTRSILAGAVAGAENSKYPLRSCLIGLFHGYRYILSAIDGNCIHGKKFPKLSREQVLMSLLLPSSIGGLAGINIASFFYKGGSDPLGKELSGIRLLADSKNNVGNLCSRALRSLEERQFIDTNPDLTLLIDNPYGIPLSKKASPLSQVGSLTLDSFRFDVNNREISPLLNQSITSQEKVLRSDLINIKPLNPLLIHDLYEASGFGTIRVMKKMFVHTRTIQTIAHKVNADITRHFLFADINEIFHYMKWVDNFPTRGYSGRSSFELCALFRSYWGVELHGVTNYQPLDFIHRYGSTRHESSIKWSAHSSSDLLTSRGPLSGYVGTATREKRSEHGYKLVDTGEPSRQIMKLQLIRSQAYGSEFFNELLENIAYTRSSLSLSSITDLLPKVIGGSISHRYSSAMRNMSASYVGPLNFVTHIRIDTNNLGIVSGSVLNYPIMLQEFIVVAQSGAKLNYLHRSSPCGELIFDPTDLIPLPEDALTSDEPKFKHVNLPKSPLLYSDTIYLSRTYDSVVGSLPETVTVPTTRYATKECISDALFAFYVVTLRNQNRAKQLADTRGYANISARYQIDIAECHAIGPVTIIQTICKALTFTHHRDTLRTSYYHPERWDESTFLNHSIPICIKTIERYLNHPLFLTHKDSTRLLGSGLRYNSGYSIKDRVAAKIRREVMFISCKIDHSYWSMSIPLFAGEDITQIIEAMTTLGCRAMVKCHVNNPPVYQALIGYFVGLTYLPRTLTSHSDYLEVLRLRFKNFAHVLEKELNYVSANEFGRISQCKYFKVYKDDIQTVLRHARSFAPNIHRTISTTKHLKTLEYADAHDHCDRCLPDQREKYGIMWTRFRQRTNGGLSTAAYTWLPLMRYLQIHRQTLIVGSGLGGLADLLISVYRCQITALDLETDLPSELATTLHYYPIGLQPEHRSHYTQSELSLITTGDIFDINVRQSFLNEVSDVSTLFVDITRELKLEECLLLESIIEHSLIDKVYYRAIVGNEDISSITSNNLPIGYKRCWAVSRSFYSVEFIVELSKSKLPYHRCQVSPVSLIDIHLPKSLHDLIPHRYGELLEAATCCRINWEGETISESKELIKSLCSVLLNKKESIQLQYRDRMSLILAYSTLCAATSEDPIQMIRNWISEESIQTDLFRYVPKPSDITHLIRYCARLSNVIFKTYIFHS
ncbi:MAG: RNA-dependent RNA polymerase [Plasmopara viticola lesion associated monoambiguivirus 1]|nr:MAG: RNA-dependent RNA polymerase [Plasmopara viticola lesion associated monoambiguivirus 1]